MSSHQRVGALVYGLGADEPTCTPLATPLLHRISFLSLSLILILALLHNTALLTNGCRCINDKITANLWRVWRQCDVDDLPMITGLGYIQQGEAAITFIIV
jgi:hypothetical protein